MKTEPVPLTMRTVRHFAGEHTCILCDADRELIDACRGIVKAAEPERGGYVVECQQQRSVSPTNPDGDYRRVRQLGVHACEEKARAAIEKLGPPHSNPRTFRVRYDGDAIVTEPE